MHFTATRGPLGLTTVFLLAGMAIATVGITFTTPTPTAQVGVPYNSACTASGGNAPYTYTISVGALPGGLGINGNTGAITGTPLAAGVFNFTCSATDTFFAPGPSGPADAKRPIAKSGTPSLTGSSAFSITVAPAASPTPVPPSIGMGLLGLAGAGLFHLRQRRRT